MNQCIDMDDPVARAHWCGTFRCDTDELANAVRVMATTEVGLVALYLATRSPTLSAGDSSARERGHA